MIWEKSLKKNVVNEIFKFIKTIFQNILQSTFQIMIVDIYSEIVNMSTILILLQSTIEYVQSNFQSLLSWSFLNLNDDDCSKNLTFFHVNMHNIVNFQIESNIMWKSEYFNLKNFV